MALTVGVAACGNDCEELKRRGCVRSPERCASFERFVDQGSKRDGGLFCAALDGDQVLETALTQADRVERYERLDRLYNAARTYFEHPRADPAHADNVMHTFPKSAPCTPAKIACGAGAKPLTSDTWSHPTWKALGFSVKGLYAHQYCLESGGRDNKATVAVTVYGDTDCDGVKSVLQRAGKGRLGASIGEAKVVPVNALKQRREE